MDQLLLVGFGVEPVRVRNLAEAVDQFLRLKCQYLRAEQRLLLEFKDRVKVNVW